MLSPSFAAAFSMLEGRNRRSLLCSALVLAEQQSRKRSVL